jgi:HPt (histidine-containing phosphotransfer) domain-containing protein
LAHSIKGLANTFGAEPLGTLLTQIEQEPLRLVAADGTERLRLVQAVAQQTIDELAKCLQSVR